MIQDRANITNQTTLAMVQAGVVDPKKAKFFDSTKIMKRILPLLGEKNVDEFDIEAKAPPPEVNGNGKGVASQTRLQGDTNLGLGSPVATPGTQTAGYG